VPAGRRRAVEAVLAAVPPPRGADLVFSHDDLDVEHVLVDAATGAVTGVIDWSDAALTGPAVDVGLVLRDLGDVACDTVLARLGGDRAARRERAVFYARCRLLEDWAFGPDGGPAVYAEKSRAALDRLFP
jgi:aminoglycoside phosphotransferase (APT) family kinase protein